MSDKKVVIAGAGLVGSLLAVILKKRGHDVTVFERRSDMRTDTTDAGRSINLVVTSRGINALQTVGMWEKVKGITVPVFGRMMHSTSSELTYQAYGRDDSECNYSISRGELNKLLMSEAEVLGAKIHFENGVSEVDAEKKIIQLEDGSTASYELLFGTDGGGSRVRKSLLNFVEGSDELVERLDADYKEMLMPAKANDEYAIEKNALHIWPRGNEMLMALPNQDGSFTMTLYMPAARFEAIQTAADLENYFKASYPDTLTIMPDYQKDYFDNPQGKLATLYCSDWVYKDSIALLGDAAHAIVPFFGQGMNCGFEDCYYLMKFLDESNDWEEAFGKYNAFQKPNGDAIAKMAIENFNEMSEKVGDPQFLLQKRVEQKVEKKFNEIYRSRYGMVTYTLAPYDLVYRAGDIQSQIIEQLSDGLKSEEEVDMQLAEKLIAEKYLPFMQEHKISIDRFKEN